MRNHLTKLNWFVRSPFRGVSVDPVLRAGIEAMPPPDRSYGILFTPRSGSTWLADLLTRNGLGQPGELFNPRRVRSLAQEVQAGTLEDYLQLMPRRMQASGVFGFKITCTQMLVTFRGEDRFARAFADAAWFWLIREDIVAQAVSGARMRQTGVARSRGRGSGVKDAAFEYRAADLRARIRRLRWHETRCERFFHSRGLSPRRLSYERMHRMGPEAVLALFAGATGVLAPAATVASGLDKVGTSKSDAFAERFRAENAGFVERIESARQSLLISLETKVS